jgi:LPXTG-motif cell wall-anchored protein
VKSGDTVTWTNRDSAPHTATASNGSFNTGTLKQGASASHTFTTAGTIAYICAIHPSMHGTVVVTGSSSSSTPGSPSGGTSNPVPTPSAGSPSAFGTLPKTGLDVLALVLAGTALMAAGAGLRRLAHRRG